LESAEDIRAALIHAEFVINDQIRALGRAVVREMAGGKR
jgi:hypothetical protein